MKFVFALLFAAVAAVRIEGEPKVTYGVRVTDVPDRFDGAESDRLMNSIIGKYS